MKHFLIFLILFIPIKFANAETIQAEKNCICCHAPSWFKMRCHRLNQVWYEGHDELYFTGYAWHNRFTYDPNKLNRYNELAWGGGYGKGFYDERGNWHALSVIAFLDSHKNVEPAAGYSFQKLHHFDERFAMGIGYSLLLTVRPDINHGIPFPGALPWLTASYRRLTLFATYIPGSGGAGNVLFLMTKLTL